MIEQAMVFLAGVAGGSFSLVLDHLWSRFRRRTLADLGPLLLAHRTKLGISQVEAAEQCGVSYWRYGMYERGNEVTDLRYLRRLATWLGIKPGEFLHEDHRDDVALPATGRISAGPDAGSAGPDREEA